MENQLLVLRIAISYRRQKISLIQIQRAFEITLILDWENPIGYKINILAISCNVLSKSEIWP
jgi:hypothetical protein